MRMVNREFRHILQHHQPFGGWGKSHQRAQQGGFARPCRTGNQQGLFVLDRVYQHRRDRIRVLER